MNEEQMTKIKIIKMILTKITPYNFLSSKKCLSVLMDLALESSRVSTCIYTRRICVFVFFDLECNNLSKNVFSF